MAALPYMQFFVADYLADTMHLTLQEHGAYLLLMMNYWQRGKPLVDDDKRLMSICSTDVNSWLEIRSSIEEFFDIKDGFWVHHRIEKDLKKVHSKSEQASIAGKASAAARAANKEVVNGRSTDVQRESNHTDTDTDTEADKKKVIKKTFKNWTPEEFREEVILKNQDNFLLEDEVEDFISYWTEPTPTGRTRMSLEKTWDTRRRMQTAFRIIFEKKRNNAPPAESQIKKTNELLDEIYGTK